MNHKYFKPVHKALQEVLFDPETPTAPSPIENHIWIYNRIRSVTKEHDESLLAKNAISDMWYLGAPVVDLAKLTYEDDREARGLITRSIPQLSIVATMGDENWQKLKNLPRWIDAKENVLHHSQRMISPDRLTLTTNPRTKEQVIYYDDEARSNIRQAMEESEHYETSGVQRGCPAHGIILNCAFERYVDVVFFPDFIDPQTTTQ